MIDNLVISFDHNGLQYSIDVPDDAQNLSYNLAEAVKELIDKSNVVPEIIIRELIDEYGYKEESND
jgi:hypothetical protein